MNTIRRTYPILACLLIYLVLCQSLRAQSPQGSILGAVTDTTGAFVVDARVIITEQNTQVAREFTTNSAGSYQASFLPVGTYAVTVEAKGFKKFHMSDVRLATGRTVRVDATLAVGDIATSVTVDGSAIPLIQVEKPTISATLSKLEIKELPSNFRYFMNYLSLMPGGSGISSTVINGGQRLAVNFVMDGVNIKDMSGGGYTAEIGAGPSVEGMEEVTVKTSTAGTDTGLGTAEVHLITKSGTNQYHGSLFEYYRSNLGEARNLFNATNKIPRSVRNQFGGSLGGPILKNRTFFFFNYEDAEPRTGSTSRVSVPTTLMRSGDFSEYPGLVLRDPSTSNSVSTQLPFANNTIPASRIDGVAKKIVDYFNYPYPNLSGITSNYMYSLVAQQSLKQYTLKVDHMLTSKDTLSVRAWQGWTYAKSPQGYDWKSAIAMRDYVVTNLQGTWARVFTPSVSNEVRFGWWNMPRMISTEDPGMNLYDHLGISGVTVTDPKAQNAGPRISFGGTGSLQFIGVSTAFPQIFKTRTGTINETLSIVTPRHSVRAGTQILIVHEPWQSTSNIRGSINYSGSTTAWWSSGHSYADFLLGTPYSSSLAQTTSGPVYLREKNYGVFITDDWKLSRTFTLSLGLRWEYLTPLTEEHNVGLSSFDQYNRVVVVNSPTVLGSFPSVIGSGNGLKIVTSQSLGLGNALQEPDKNNWAPRLGIAWRPFGKDTTVIRGGYGVYFADQCLLWQGRQATNQPWVTSYSYSSSTAVLTNSQPFASGARQAPTYTSFDRYFRTSYTQQWNLTLEKLFRNDIAWRISYVGNKGTDLRQPLNINQATSVAKVGSSLVYTYPFPELSGATTSFSMANSTYNALQTEVKKRWSKGLTFNANWTWAKAIDTDHDDSTPMNSYSLNADRGNSSYVSRHTVVAWGVYDLPVGKGRPFLTNAPKWLDGIAGGWNVSGTSRYWTGQYVSLAANVGTRPDVVLGVDPFEDVPAGRWFNPAAYTATYYNSDSPAIVFGNSARNSLRTPNQYQLDLSLAKSFYIREGHRVSVRAECFNAPNHPNLATPSSTNINDTANVGKITSAAQARYFQWSLRYEF